MSAYTWRQTPATAGQLQTVRGTPFFPGMLLCAIVTLLAGCQANWMSLSGPQTQPGATRAKAPATASAPATRPQPASTSGPESANDPAAQLTQEIQQYVNNLPMDDLQAKLSRHQGLPASATRPLVAEPEAAPMVTPAEPPASLPPAVQPTPAPAITASASANKAAQANRHVPLQPELILPDSAGASEQPVARQPQLPALTPPSQSGNSQIVEIDISPAALASLASQPANPRVVQPRTNQPAAVKPGPSDELKHMIEQLRKEAADRPDSVGAALRLRLAEWSLTGSASPEEWPLQDADKRRLAQSIWQVLQVVSTMDASPQGAATGDFQKAIESLTGTLQQVQPLQIPAALLCRSVSSFGCPDAMPEPWQFPAGRTNMVVLYCELAGFKSEPAPARANWYHALLSLRLAILTTSGKELWHDEDQQVEDSCRRPRRDFFITKLLKIRDDIPVGDYVLKVTIRDKLANRVTETNIPFGITLASGS